MKISLCMIVKNEEKYMKMCLENAMKLADEAIIVDTGSTDRTKEIIEEFKGNIKVIDYKWEDDFSKARNVSLENATGDWILMLDADEKLLCNAEKVKELIKNSNFEAYKIPLYNIMGMDKIIYSSVYLKLFKNKKEYRYSGRIHEQLSIPDGNDEESSLDVNICKVMHYGYLKETFDEKQKAKRNLKILKKQLEEEPSNPFVYYNIGATYEAEEEFQKALKYFFKCNTLLKRESETGVTEYEIDMVKRICNCLINLRGYNECIEFVDTVLQDPAYKGFTDLKYMQGYCYFLKKDYMEAKRCFMECTQMGENKKFISILGMGSFKAKLMMARCNIQLKEEVNAINSFMECIFDSNNFMKEGLEEFREYLRVNNRIEILNQLNKLVGEKQ